MAMCAKTAPLRTGLVKNIVIWFICIGHGLDARKSFSFSIPPAKVVGVSCSARTLAPPFKRKPHSFSYAVL